MIGSSGSMIGSGGAFASHASRIGKMRPKAVLVGVPLMADAPWLVLFSRLGSFVIGSVWRQSLDTRAQSPGSCRADKSDARCGDCRTSSPKLPITEGFSGES